MERGDSEAALAAARLDGPPGALPVRFDFLEVCCGRDAPLSRACAAAGLRVGPRVDRARNGFWNLLDDGVFGWLLDVVTAGRVFFLFAAPPCTTFSVARRPALRDLDHPYGFNPEEAKTKEGARLFLRCLALL